MRFSSVGAAAQYIARDVLGFNLNYFSGEYLPIGGANPFAGHSAYLPAGQYKPLYNGNISSMAVNIGFPSATAVQVPQLYNYSYDQLNRITGMDVYRGLDTVNNSWAGLTATTDYKERVSFDANGNILKYLRNGTSAVNINMDSLTYHYKPGTNQLKQVRDAVDGAYTEDIDNQTDPDNYVYDAIGNLIADKKDSISLIKWNVYGKIAEIQRVPSVARPVSNIQYTYDAAGNRISKRVEKQGSATVEYTWYVRDGFGNVIAVYDSKGTSSISSSAYSLLLVEQHLYSGSRLGILNRNISVKKIDDNAGIFNFTRGNKFFELSNHLGNVLATISDKKTAVDTDNNGLIDYYQVDLVTANDYYPGGMLMPERKFTQAGSNYRYGFNGQEKSDDVTAGNYTAMYWEYDSRIVRRWNLDPVPKVGESEYACFGNNPIFLSDVNGDDPDPPGKKSKSYDWVSALHYQAIHYNGARVAYNIYRIRQARGHFGTKYNAYYRDQLTSYAASSYQREDMSVTGISEAAYAKEIGGYYESFEKGFNWAGDRTMRELKFIFDNKYKAATDIFKPSLTANEAYVAWHQSQALLDDLTGTAETIGAWGEEVFMKCVMFAGLFTNRAGNYTGKYNLSNTRLPYKGSGLQQKIVNAELDVDPRIAKSVASFNKNPDPYDDCSDIASYFNSRYSGGYILEIAPKSGKWMNGIEYGSKTEFTYHQVFVKGNYVYDPMFGSKPVLKSEFLKTYQNLNPGGINQVIR